MLLRKLRYRVILQYLKYTIFRKLIVPHAIFKILLLIAVAPFQGGRVTHRIPDTKNPLVDGLKLRGKVTPRHIIFSN
ncbi:hypothetical protein EFV11_24945 [Escherichia coli]|nr:hypothetical protein EFV11_24945 [Escherichia coli]